MSKKPNKKSVKKTILFYILLFGFIASLIVQPKRTFVSSKSNDVENERTKKLIEMLKSPKITNPEKQEKTTPNVDKIFDPELHSKKCPDCAERIIISL